MHVSVGLFLSVAAGQLTVACCEGFPISVVLCGNGVSARFWSISARAQQSIYVFVLLAVDLSFHVLLRLINPSYNIDGGDTSLISDLGGSF